MNLFVGRNNAGKSALLEAIEVYLNNASFQTLLNIVSAREETWGGSNASAESLDALPPNNEFLRHLFRGHYFPSVDEEGIILGPLNESLNQLQVAIAAYQTIEKDEGGSQRLRIDANQYSALRDEAKYPLVNSL